jgi:L-lactate dehydrogenase complex protein LldG
MTTSRDMILAAVRANAPSPAIPMPQVPTFDRDGPSLLERFRAGFELLGGTFVDYVPGTDLNAKIGELFPQAKVICSATAEVTGNKSLQEIKLPADLDDVDVAVVRPAFAVAETGSIWLSEAELGVNALGYLAQHLVALLDPADIVANLHHAYRDPRFMTAKYAVLMTGPSATADIEGVLIRGAQGIRSLKLIPAPRAPSPSRRQPAPDIVRL